MWVLSRVSMEGAGRRLRHLQAVLSPSGARSGLRIRLSSSSGDGTRASIGDISIILRDAKNPELVPRKYMPASVSQSVLRHLRWIMQKDLLGQDVFLIGPPGPFRREVAMMYLELTQRESEYISLSRDTTESDLKQRREIQGGTAFYIDQCAVRAALEGRILVLEGIEKAERNVLPVLNNLLENREMQLDDGRFLVAADRYDKLLQDHSKEELDSLNLVRVSERFRVIALGLPIPRYQGNPLDPPLRSRFQARDVHSLPFKEVLETLQENTRNVAPERISQLLSFASTMLTAESTSLGLPDFPLDNLVHLVRIMDTVPSVSSLELIQRLYPYNIMLGKEGKTAVEDTLSKFELIGSSPVYSVGRVDKQGNEALVTLSQGRDAHPVQVAAGTLPSSAGDKDSPFIRTGYHDALLSEMLQSHVTTDFCLVGPRGCGKSVLVKQFADMLGYHTEPIMLYQDMTSRDLLQQRTTLPNGDTTWRHSPLVTAALEGSLAVLDGVHRINPGSFSVLHRLVHERDLQLYDGTRLLRHDRYQDIQEKTGLSQQQLEERRIFPIHPSFRLIALGEPPVVGSSKQQWMSPEMLTMFLYHHMRPLSRAEETDVIHRLVPNADNLSKLFDFVHNLRDSTDPTVQSMAASMSTRQLLRIARSLAQYPNEDLYGIVQKACLSRFLPRLARQALDQTLDSAGIQPLKQDHSMASFEKSVTCEVQGDMLRIGSTTVPVYNPQNKTKVPDILFYENPQHLSVMEDMLKDFTLGEHLLLVGNQGVGKNKIVDRFLQMLNRPREYIQLHRDTTVQTLTLQPTVQDGVIIYEDSPLVKAVKQGHVLVVDEADKAPTYVTCVLKTLVESGEMHLADGRRILSARTGISPSSTVIVAHPDFRMIVLANRPGFPFLGNDFFGAMGDIFSCHAIDNPDIESEMAMLRQYGPSVSEGTLRKLVMAFGELRDMADQGLISYPYSTREVVNMVRHIQKFPNEGLTTVVKNVFDFDSYNQELQETIVQTMEKHGIPLGVREARISLAKEFPLPNFEMIGQWKTSGQGMRQKTSLMSLPVDTTTIGVKGPVAMYLETKPLDRTEARSAMFTEQEAYWQLPMEEMNIICDVAVSKASHRSPGQNKTDMIYVATANPIGLYAMDTKKKTCNFVDLYDVFPSTSGSYKPRVKIQALSSPLDDSVILHEEVTNVVLSVNIENGQVTRLMSDALPETPPEKRRFPTSSPKVVNPFRLCPSFAPDGYNTVVFYKQNGGVVNFISALEGICHSVSLPVNIHTIHQIDSNKWLITESSVYGKYVMERTAPAEFMLQPVKEHGDLDQKLLLTSTTPLSDSVLSKALEQKISSPNRVAVTPGTYASVLLGFPDLETTEVYGITREPLPTSSSESKSDPFLSLMSKPAAPNPASTNVFLPESGQIIRALPTWKVGKDILPKDSSVKDLSGYLELADIANHKLRYIPVPGATRVSPYASWLFNAADVNVFMAPLSNDGLVTVDMGGCVRTWETTLVHLERSLQEWRNMIGYQEDKPLQLTIEKESGRDDHEDIDPKHGKVDPDNQPHVGGNTWAGGVGGSGTAGLGGFGGPYRLDAGHDVQQVPQWEKDAVPESVREAARQMKEKAFKERLREIQMSEYDGETYDKFSNSVKRQVQSLRVILESLQAKGKERQWLKNQSYGDLDDSKLIEGLTGEKSIYRRRGEKEPEMGTPQEKPKRLRLVVDVSGSMYRFNGHDGRLEREMEATLMVMEAFEKYEDKFKYDIYGHSGEDYRVEFVNADKPPTNNRERLNVLKLMHAHSQFCLSGDNTLEATKDAIKVIGNEEADEHFVLLLSDANFDRYGIRPSRFAEILNSNEDVNAYAIFIGSLGDQAVRLTKQLPMGHAYVCMDNKNLPQILQQIFTSTMLST
ncbi:von Willebrand factor A domain-containing protein 8-like [Haliotis asinina]|uniref:von Willebrand factor A domain-containing protein 8-like n=1 Tax=Haliotis asinina TaxID=109174 RepID=UPI003531A830